jgi:sortase A
MGVVGLGVWAWSVVRTEVYEDWENWAFDHQVRGEHASINQYLAQKIVDVRQRISFWLKTPAPPEAPSARSIVRPPELRQPILEKNGLVGRLRVPRLHLSGMVREGTGEDTLGLSLGHIPSTAFPGQKGNVAVAGHRDTLFRGLGGIHQNDMILFETLGAKYVYQVEATQIVKPEDVSVLKAGEHPELTLITCYPFNYVGSAPDRFIVKARQVSQDVVDRSTVEAQQHSGEAGNERAEAAQHPEETRQRATSEPPAVRHSGLNRAALGAPGLKGVANDPAVRKVTFSVSANHSRELAPGISLGLTRTDVAGHRVDGWIWVMPDRKTIWLREQNAHQPLIFYGAQDGRRRELVITTVTRNSIGGYLILPPVSVGKTTVRRRLLAAARFSRK